MPEPELPALERPVRALLALERPDPALLPLDRLDRALLPLDREPLAPGDRELPERWLAADLRVPAERELPDERELRADFELPALRELPEDREALPGDRDALPDDRDALPPEREALAVLLFDPVALCERARVDFCSRCVAFAGFDGGRLEVPPRLPEPR